MNETEVDVYRKLQQHLDKLPVGYPATESGVEIRILKHLFTPDEAEIALKLKMIPDPLDKIYRRVKRTGITKEELEKKLDHMVNRGSINFGEQGGIKYYAVAFLAVGMFEYQLNNLTEDFMRDFHQYLDEGFDKMLSPVPKMPQLRTVPVQESITPEHTLGNYDSIREIIQNSRGPISIAKCICRQGKELLGGKCQLTDSIEWCLQFGRAAQLFMDQGQSREISKEEALDVIQKAQKAGFVINPANSQRPYAICLCCGCCCEFLNTLKKFDKPVEHMATNYYAEVDAELCEHCATCETRCQMEAIEMVDDLPEIDLDRCIGCGLCVVTCPAEALSLTNIDEELVPPRHTAAYLQALMDKQAEIARAEKGK